MSAKTEKVSSFGGIATTLGYDAGDDSFFVRDSADVERVIDTNKALQNSPQMTRSKNMRRVASIPLHILFDLERRGITKDEKAFKRWLEDPDNRFFRTDLSRL